MARKGKFGKNSGNEGQAKHNDTHAKREGNFVKKNHKTESGLTKKDQKRHEDPAKKGVNQVVVNLGGLIFMCSAATKTDCYKYRVFGLNEGRKKLVEQVRKGMRLFLFDVDLRLLYGVYTAASTGSYKLEPDAFRGQFPWQVRFSIQKDCLPLSEDIFKAAIKENYLDERRFKVELTTEQVHRLVRLFRPIPGAPGFSPPRSRVSVQGRLDVSPRVVEYDTRIHSHPPPRTLYEPAYIPSDLNIPEKQGYGESRTKYADFYRSGELSMNDRVSLGVDRKSIYTADDLYMAPDARAYRGIDPVRYDTGISSGVSGVDLKSIYPSDDPYIGRELRAQRGIDSVLSEHSLSSLSRPPYHNDPLRPLSDLQPPRGREDLSSAFLYGRMLGNTIPEVDSMSGRSLLPDARGSVLDRRLAALDPLAVSDRRLAALHPLADRLPLDVGRNVVDRKLAAVDPLVDGYLGGLSSEVLPGRATLVDPHGTGRIGLSRVDDSASMLAGGISSVSGLSYRDELLPRPRYYGL